jgi:nitrite reductase/ring-hydroxylating ferredoxin subunit
MAAHQVRLKRRREIAEGTMAFHFEWPPGFAFKAGQAISWTLVDPRETDAGDYTRNFSIASAPGGRARRVGLMHGVLNVGATALYGASLWMRRRGDRRTGRNLACLGYAASLSSAYLGGHLVFGEQIGVDHTAALGLPREFMPLMPERSLPEGEMRRAEIDGVSVLLARRNREIHALVETCAHMGGPLAEGTLIYGSVRCPWHGSRYALEDGRVLDGPSAFPQPCFETRIRDGQIEVRAARPK